LSCHGASLAVGLQLHLKPARASNQVGLLERAEEGAPMWQDVMFALKGMRKSPRVSLTVLLTLALGIGANSAIFSIVNAALLRPLPYHEPGQLVQLNADERGVGSQNLGFSYPELQDLSDRAGIFDGVSVSWQAPANLTGGEHPERVEFLAVSPNYFSILGSHPQLGRLFDSRDTADGFAYAAVISDSYWHSEFGGSSDIIGHKMRLDNDLYTIVGVLPASFSPPTSSVAGPVDLWITAGFHAAPFPPPNRSFRFLPALVARLKPGISIEEARARLASFSNSLRHDYADDYPAASRWTITLTPLRNVVVGDSRTLLVSLMLAVGLVLLIACVNVANVLLANASARQREISIRMALGADRARIARQFLTESAILSVMACIAGIVAASVSLRFLVAVLPSQLPHVNSISIDGRVLAFSVATAFLTTFLFGLMPALEAAQPQRFCTAAGDQDRACLDRRRSSFVGDAAGRRGIAAANLLEPPSCGPGLPPAASDYRENLASGAE
jgi:predicted permease